MSLFKLLREYLILPTTLVIDPNRAKKWGLNGVKRHPHIAIKKHSWIPLKAGTLGVINFTIYKYRVSNFYDKIMFPREHLEYQH